MQAVAHDRKFAAKVGVAQSVGKDFEAADEAKKTKKTNASKLYTKGK